MSRIKGSYAAIAVLDTLYHECGANGHPPNIPVGIGKAYKYPFTCDY